MVKPNNPRAGMWKKGSNGAETNCKDPRPLWRKGADAQKQKKLGCEQVPVFKPSLKWYTYTITCLGKQGSYRQALSVLREMENRGVEANIYTYNAAIGALSRAGKYAQSFALLLEMEKKNIQPDVISYNATISACAKGEQPDMCLELLEQMKERTLKIPYSPKPDSITYNTSISACEKANLWRECLHLLQEMQDRKLDVDKMAFNNTLLALERAREWVHCTLLFHEMRAYTTPETGAPVEPDCVSYSVAGNALCNIRDWWKLRKHVEEMQMKHMSLDLRTYQRLVALIVLALTERNDDASEELLREVLSMVIQMEETKMTKKKHVRKNGNGGVTHVAHKMHHQHQTSHHIPNRNRSSTHNSNNGVSVRSQPSQPSQLSWVPSESSLGTATGPSAHPPNLNHFGPEQRARADTGSSHNSHRSQQRYNHHSSFSSSSGVPHCTLPGGPGSSSFCAHEEQVHSGGYHSNPLHSNPLKYPYTSNEQLNNNEPHNSNNNSNNNNNNNNNNNLNNRPRLRSGNSTHSSTHSSSNNGQGNVMNMRRNTLNNSCVLGSSSQRGGANEHHPTSFIDLMTHSPELSTSTQFEEDEEEGEEGMPDDIFTEYYSRYSTYLKNPITEYGTVDTSNASYLNYPSTPGADEEESLSEEEETKSI